MYIYVLIIHTMTQVYAVVLVTLSNGETHQCIIEFPDRAMYNGCVTRKRKVTLKEAFNNCAQPIDSVCKVTDISLIEKSFTRPDNVDFRVYEKVIHTDKTSGRFTVVTPELRVTRLPIH